MFGRQQGEPKNMDVLQNIESAVAHTYKTHRKLEDTEVIKAYDALIEFYRKKVTKQTPNTPELEEFSMDIYDNVQAILIERLGAVENQKKEQQPSRRRFSRRAFKKSETEEEKILGALRRLKKSAEMWNKEKGVRGYLDFISRFV